VIESGLSLIIGGSVLYECAAHCAAIEPRPIALSLKSLLPPPWPSTYLELSTGTLPVEILEIRQDRWLVKRVRGVDLGVGVAPVEVPFLVVMMMTPFAARDPYKAAALGPLSTDMDAMSLG